MFSLSWLRFHWLVRAAILTELLSDRSVNLTGLINKENAIQPWLFWRVAEGYWDWFRNRWSSVCINRSRWFFLQKTVPVIRRSHLPGRWRLNPFHRSACTLEKVKINDVLKLTQATRQNPTTRSLFPSIPSKSVVVCFFCFFFWNRVLACRI